MKRNIKTGCPVLVVGLLTLMLAVPAAVPLIERKLSFDAAKLEAYVRVLTAPEMRQADRRAIDAIRGEMAVPPGDVFDLERDREGRHGRIMKYNLNTGS